MRRSLVLALGLILALAPGAFAQFATGNIYGTVTDESGAVLPGASISLTSDLGSRTTTSGSQGDFRFLNLDRGSYKLAVSLAGFGTVTREVAVVTGENVNLTFNMKVAQVAETVTVTADTPLVDIKRRGTSTTMTTDELQKMPNARDPWGVLRNVPGVLTDRVNIAGSENGQQAAVAGKGSMSADKVWNLDGVNVTDMSATGASPSYFDFEAFQEINVTTGGNDMSLQGGGIGINLVTKRGTNRFHGGARYLLADSSLASSNLPDALKGDARLQGSKFADHVENLKDYGFELGGPLIKDKLWFYGTFGRQNIFNVRLAQTPDKTILDSYNGKLNWQASSDTMVSAFYFLGNKKKFGRQNSFPVQPTDDFTWNQANAYTPGGLPGGMWKLQVDHTFSPNFFVSAKATYYDTGFGFVARGGPDKTFTVDYVNNIGIGSYSDFATTRPLKLGQIDGSYFFAGMGGNNELKFGFSYRDVSTHSATSYNGNQIGGIYNSATDFSQNVAQVFRGGVVDYSGKYGAAYLGDTWSKSRMTINAGLRWDKQTATNNASEAPANISFPTVLPALQYTGANGNIVDWSDISPRVGLSYSLDDSRKTIVRASFARYASQLSYGEVATNGENPVSTGLLAYGWNDKNGDKFVQPNEVELDNFLYNVNIDPAHPAAVGNTVNKIDRDYTAKHDLEFILGVDHELAGNFAVGAAYTWRRARDFTDRLRLGGICSDPTNPTLDTCRTLGPSDYTANAPVINSGLTARTFSPNAALVTAGGGGRLRTNRDGYFTLFNGVELTATKRLSNKWMARAAFSWNNWTENWDSGVIPTSALGNPGRTDIDPVVDGGQLAALSGGSGKASFYTSVKWQFYANALVQLPWSVDLSGSLFGKQGGPFPNTIRIGAGRDGTLNALATPLIDTNRLDNVWDVDLRLAKNVHFGQGALTVSAELFNVLNNDVVLSRARSAGPTLGRIEEIIVPRTLRLGARLSF